MFRTRSRIWGVVLAFALAGCSAWADDLDRVLRELDKSAANFQTTTADFEFDTIQTDPFPDRDVQKGTVFYGRNGSGFEMGMHIVEVNGKPIQKIIVVSGGVFRMYEPLIDQVTQSNKAGKYESYLVLAFGASGKDLEQKWNIRYLGPETISGVKTVKLELVAKDPDVLRLFPKVTVWIDPTRAVSLKQYFDEGQGQSRTCTYTNIKVNETLPVDAFTFKTDSKTQIVTK